MWIPTRVGQWSGGRVGERTVHRRREAAGDGVAVPPAPTTNRPVWLSFLGSRVYVRVDEDRRGRTRDERDQRLGPGWTILEGS